MIPNCYGLILRYPKGILNINLYYILFLRMIPVMLHQALEYLRVNFQAYLKVNLEMAVSDYGNNVI